jgi:hypothetical protein
MIAQNKKSFPAGSNTMKRTCFEADKTTRLRDLAETLKAEIRVSSTSFRASCRYYVGQ